MGGPLSNHGLVPGPAESGPEFIAVSVNVDRENLDWLDRVAEDTKRSRSDVVREILRAVRAKVTNPVKAKVTA